MIDQPKHLTGWSKNVTLKTGGGSGQGTETTARPTNFESLQCEFPEAGDFTIEFNLQVLDGPPPGVGAFYMAEALITLSVAGNFSTRRVSIVNGTSISGVAKAVKIQMWDTTPTPGSAYAMNIAMGLRYNVSAQVSLGVRPGRNGQPVLAPTPGVPAAGTLAANVFNDSPGFYFVNAVGNSAIDIPIPADAGINAIMVLAAWPVGAAVSDPLTVSGQALAELRNESGLFGTAQWYPILLPGTWVQVPPGSDHVELINVNIPGRVSGNLLFTVVFGIDA